MDGPDFGSLMQVFGAMLLLLGGLAGVLYVLKRFGHKAGLGGMGRGDMSLEGQLALGPRKSVAVVRCAGQRLVLGVTDERINLLARLDEPAGDFEAALEKQMSGGQSRG